MLEFSKKKKIDTITTSNFYSKFKENNENDIAAHAFWAVFCSSRGPRQICETADFDCAAIPPSRFSIGVEKIKNVLIAVSGGNM